MSTFTGVVPRVATGTRRGRNYEMGNANTPSVVQVIRRIFKSCTTQVTSLDSTMDSLQSKAISCSLCHNAILALRPCAVKPLSLRPYRRGAAQREQILTNGQSMWRMWSLWPSLVGVVCLASTSESSRSRHVVDIVSIPPVSVLRERERIAMYLVKLLAQLESV